VPDKNALHPSTNWKYIVRWKWKKEEFLYNYCDFAGEIMRSFTKRLKIVLLRITHGKTLIYVFSSSFKKELIMMKKRSRKQACREIVGR